METKAQILKEVKELADKLLDERKISGFVWARIKFTDIRKLYKRELVEWREQLLKAERA